MEDTVFKCVVMQYIGNSDNVICSRRCSCVVLRPGKRGRIKSLSHLLSDAVQFHAYLAVLALVAD